MSLFVGNVSKKATEKEFEDEFRLFGKCKVDLRKGFAFVQYENQRNAEDAKKQLQYKNFCGLKFNIEWSKNSGRFNENTKNHHRGYQGMSHRRGRSISRDRNGRDDRWARRSPSYQRRSSPEYSEPDVDSFVPQCPRDRMYNKSQHSLLNHLLQKQQEKRQADLQRRKQAELNGEILNENEGQPRHETGEIGIEQTNRNHAQPLPQDNQQPQEGEIQKNGRIEEQ